MLIRKYLCILLNNSRTYLFYSPLSLLALLKYMQKFPTVNCTRLARRFRFLFKGILIERKIPGNVKVLEKLNAKFNVVKVSLRKNKNSNYS